MRQGSGEQRVALHQGTVVSEERGDEIGSILVVSKLGVEMREQRATLGKVLVLGQHVECIGNTILSYWAETSGRERTSTRSTVGSL